MRLTEALVEFSRGQAGIAADATIAWYQKRLAVLSHLGHLPLAEVTPTHLRRVWSELVGRKRRWEVGARRPPQEGGLSPHTLDGYYRAWKHFFAWCVDQEFIERNPVKKLNRPALPSAPPKAISEFDLTKLIEAATDLRDYVLVTFIALSGCRLGGAAGLTLKDIDFVTGRVYVTEKGKGGGQRRLVYLHGDALAALAVYVNRAERQPDDHVFLSHRGKTPLTEGGIYQIFSRLARISNVKGLHNPHSVRHRFARSVLQNGGDLSIVSQLMGHRDPTVTIKFYARWADKELKAKARRFARLPTDRSDPASGDS